MCKIVIVQYSMYGHIYKMAEAVAEGVRQVAGCEAVITRVPETLSDEVLGMMGALDAQKSMAHIPVATLEDLAGADALIFGTPTRFGAMCGQMRQFLDSTGGLWMKGALTGKPGSVFTSTGTGAGNETTITSFHSTLLHHGMIIVGVPYSVAPELFDVSVTRGGSPYGASTLAGGDGSRQPSDAELSIATKQGAHVARIAKKLKS